MCAAVADTAVWFPAISTGTGTDVFTVNLCQGLREAGVRAEITWLPPRCEFAPWAVTPPRAPAWATIAHVNSWFPVRLLPKNLPYVATVHLCVHDPKFVAFKSWPQTLYHRAWIQKVERKTLKKATAVSAVSYYTRSQTRAVFGDLAIDVVPNTVSRMLGYPVTGNERAARTPFRLVYVGSWSSRKGADLLPEIMIQLGPGYRLDCYGGTPSRHSRLPPNMHIHGRLSNMAIPRAYASSDAFLFPSRLEGYGLVIAEAQAAGLPVVASNTSAIPEVVRNGVDGILCDPDDVFAFVTAIRELDENSALRAELSTNARQTANTRPDRRQWAHQYLEWYKAQTRKADRT